jgi:hypothetical protein
MTDAPKTWADSAKDITTSIAHWALAECAKSGTRWTELTDGHDLIMTATRIGHTMAERLGIPTGAVTLTPGDTLAATQALARDGAVPSAPLPMQEEPVVISTTVPASGAVTSGTSFSAGTVTSSIVEPVSSSTVTSGGSATTS